MANVYSNSGRTKNVYVVPTISSGAYSAGTQVGSLFKIAGIAYDIGQGAVLQHVTLTDNGKQSVEMEIWLFNQSVTLTSVDTGTFAPLSANIRGKKIGAITTSGLTYKSTTNFSECLISPIGVACQPLPTTSSQDIYGVLVTRGTPTFGSTTALELCFGFLQDS